MYYSVEGFVVLIRSDNQSAHTLRWTEKALWLLCIQLWTQDNKKFLSSVIKISVRQMQGTIKQIPQKLPRATHLQGKKNSMQISWFFYEDFPHGIELHSLSSIKFLHVHLHVMKGQIVSALTFLSISSLQFKLISDQTWWKAFEICKPSCVCVCLCGHARLCKSGA